MTNSLFIAHTADAVEFISVSNETAVQNYDATADLAATLLAEYPYLMSAADAYSQGTVGAADFEAVVRRALSNR
jgi:hypothetical protein